jgi:hypothetical protein
MLMSLFRADDESMQACASCVTASATPGTRFFAVVDRIAIIVA